MHAEHPVVNFIIAGAQKSGTTALDFYLRNHPAITMATRKEVHFFDKDHNFVTSLPDYSYYHSFFSNNARTIMCGESTPNYMFYEQALERIFHYNSDIKLIILLRNPVLRAYSHWNMQRNRNIEPLEFMEAIKQEARRCTTNKESHQKFSYLQRSCYSTQLKRVFDLFPKEQVYVERSGHLFQKTKATLIDIFRFLEVDDSVIITPEIIHALPYDSTISNKDYNSTVQLLEDDIRSLENIVHWDCSSWLKRRR